MKICKRLSALVLCLLMVLLIPLSARAMDNIDTSKAVSLTVTAAYGEAPIPGMEFDAYRISTVDDCGELTVTGDYQKFATDLDIRGKNDEAWQKMAQTLSAYIAQGGVAATISAETGENGIASFPGIVQGLYLVIGKNVVKDGYVYSTSPFFVMLPEQNATGSSWNYDVTAKAKPGQEPVRADYEVIKIWKDKGYLLKRPTEITVTLLCDGKEYEKVTLSKDNNWKYTWKDLDTNHTWTVTEARVKGYEDPKIKREGNTFTVTNTRESPNIPYLPQTGQLWWPVPVLIAAGLFFVLIGLLRRKGSTDET